MGEGKHHKAMKNEIIESLKNNGYLVIKETYVGTTPLAHGNIPRKRVDIFALKGARGFAIEIYTLKKKDFKHLMKRQKKRPKTVYGFRSYRKIMESGIGMKFLFGRKKGN